MACLIPSDTYDFSNSETFYALCGARYLNYYQKVVKKCQQWLDGYDPSFHKQQNGIVSTRIGAKINAGVAKQLFGRGLVFLNGQRSGGDDNRGVEFISHEWRYRDQFQQACKQAIAYAYPLGTAMMKLNRDSTGEIWAETLRADYFYFTCDASGKVLSCDSYVALLDKIGEDAKTYVIVESRYFDYPKVSIDTIEGKRTCDAKQKVGYVKYRIFDVDVTSNQNYSGALSGQGLNYRSLPAEVKKALADSYGAIKIDDPQRLPYKDSLGCFLIKNEGGDFTHPGLPFGYAAFFDCLTDFMEFDLNKSYAIRDLSNSKGIVGVPKGMTQSTLVPGTAGNLQNVQNPLGQIEIPGFEMIPGLNPEDQKPVIIQFEIRADEHERKEDAILKSIATTLGISPRAIASYLVEGNQKTAEQTHSEDDSITNWVKNHRRCYVDAFNQVVEEILSYKGITANVEARFASDGLIDETRQLDLIEKRLNLGLMTIKDAVKELNPDLDEKQLEEKTKEAEALYKEKTQQSTVPFGEYGL